MHPRTTRFLLPLPTLPWSSNDLLGQPLALRGVNHTANVLASAASRMVLVTSQGMNSGHGTSLLAERSSSSSVASGPLVCCSFLVLYVRWSVEVCQGRDGGSHSSFVAGGGWVSLKQSHSPIRSHTHTLHLCLEVGSFFLSQRLSLRVLRL